MLFWHRLLPLGNCFLTFDIYFGLFSSVKMLFVLNKIWHSFWWIWNCCVYYNIIFVFSGSFDIIFGSLYVLFNFYTLFDFNFCRLWNCFWPYLTLLSAVLTSFWTLWHCYQQLLNLFCLIVIVLVSFDIVFDHFNIRFLEVIAYVIISLIPFPPVPCPIIV